jgi:hypothetical protein
MWANDIAQRGLCEKLERQAANQRLTDQEDHRRE